MPESIPDDFPVPANAAVGATMVDPVNNRTEVRLQMAGTVTSVIRFFEVGLVNQGYVVDSSTGSPVEWTLRFSDGPLDGRVVISQEDAGVIAVVSVNAA